MRQIDRSMDFIISFVAYTSEMMDEYIYNIEVMSVII